MLSCVKEYLFHASKTKEGKESKYNEIVNVLRKLVSKEDSEGNALYEDYEVCSTGHSLGGALAKLLIFMLGGQDPIDTIQLPITAVTFSAPAVGNQEFLRKFRWMEIQGVIQHIQVTNFGDVIPLFWGHAGVSLQFFNDKKPKLKYSYYINTLSRTAKAAAAMANLSTVHIISGLMQRIELDVNSEVLSYSVDDLYRISGATKTFHRKSHMMPIDANKMSLYAKGVHKTCCCFGSKYDMALSKRQINMMKSKKF